MLWTAAHRSTTCSEAHIYIFKFKRPFCDAATELEIKNDFIDSVGAT